MVVQILLDLEKKWPSSMLSPRQYWLFDGIVVDRPLEDLAVSLRAIGAFQFKSCGNSAWCPSGPEILRDYNQLHLDLRSLSPKALFQAPVLERPMRVLELGTGSGAWSMEIARLYPNCQVVGVDVIDTFPSDPPENCRFETANIEDAFWTPKKDHYDFIFIRNIAGYIADRSWSTIYAKIQVALAPGGYFEHSEFKLLSPAPAWKEWLQLCNDTEGRKTEIAESLVELFESAQFKDIRSDTVLLSGHDLEADVLSRVLSLGSRSASISEHDMLCLGRKMAEQCKEHYDKDFAKWITVYASKQ